MIKQVGDLDGKIVAEATNIVHRLLASGRSMQITDFEDFSLVATLKENRRVIVDVISQVDGTRHVAVFVGPTFLSLTEVEKQEENVSLAR